MPLRHRLRTLALIIAVICCLFAAPHSAASADGAQKGTADVAVAPGVPGDPTTASDERTKLAPGWRTSTDQLWTLSGDATGLHVMAAAESSAYSWRTVATLGDPAVDTDQWIGNGCLTRSGRYAVVVYAPRSFTNHPSTYLRGGSAAVVDMTTGQVRELDVQATLSYFNPGCGTGEDAVITAQRFPEESGVLATRLVRVHADAATTERAIEKRGQYVGAVPTRTGVVATRADSIVALSPSGAQRTVSTRKGGAFDLRLDAAGDLVYLTGTQKDNQVERVHLSSGAARPTTLARAKGSWMDLQSGTGGQVFVLAEDSTSRDLGQGVSAFDGGFGDEVSTHGHALIRRQKTPDPGNRPGEFARSKTVTLGSRGERRIDLTAELRSTGRTIDFRVSPGVRPSRFARSASLSSAAATFPTGATGPGDGAEATCAVPRNDPATQVYQPTPRQIEWAANQAVVNNLKTARPANWKKSGLASWAPQQMFPSTPLAGGGRVPTQVLLGILAQESNLWQSSHTLSGEFGNPLVGDFYGRRKTASGWGIDYAEADCGYGVGQVTDGMRKADTSLTATQKRAIAMDYATNISRALQILQEKWNLTYNAGLRQEAANPKWLESWIFAIWAYNTGFYPNKGDGSPWGVGYLNNPANPNYPPNRTFFNTAPTDAKTPNLWPYPELVIGWAAYSIATPEGPGFRPAWWTTPGDRTAAKPPVYQFCDTSNACTPGAADPCPAFNESCWWHKPVTYRTCSNGSSCANELLRFDTTYPEQPDGTNFPPSCTLAGLPSGAWVVDDVANNVAAPRAGCDHPWTNKGTFSLQFSDPSARIDFHQIGGGFGGHFWFGHTRQAGTEPAGYVRGTWNYNTALHQWARVMVHMPDHGAHTQQAAYEIRLGDGTAKTRYALQRTQSNRWVDLGVVKFNGIPSIRLSSETHDGIGEDDIAFDATAIVPLAAKPKHIVVALGDSYSSGEGANNPDGGDDYYPETDYGGEYATSKPTLRNACHRSPHAWSRTMVLSDQATTSVGARADALDPTLSYQLLACSGAESENLLPYYTAPAGQAPQNGDAQLGTGQYGEVSQLDKGYLDADTTLVTLSIGGNDAYFSDVVKSCVAPANDCRQSNSTGAGPNTSAIPARISGTVKISVEQVVRQIHGRAPNAKVLLMGYPELLSDNAECLGGLGISPDEAQWVNQMTKLMADELKNSVAKLKAEGIAIVYGDPYWAFQGKGVCGNPQEINGLVLQHTAGDPPPTVTAPQSAQSFHPNIGGTTDYAFAADEALSALGY